MSNAKLLQIFTPGVPSEAGDLTSPNFQLQRKIDELKSQATAVMYVAIEDFPAAYTLLLDNCQVSVQQDGQSAQLYRIDKAIPTSASGISNVVCLLRQTRQTEAS